MRKVTYPSLLLWSVVCLTISACQLSPESPSMTMAEIIGYFDFHTSRDVSMRIFFDGQQAARLPDVPFEIAMSPEFENNQSVFARLTTGADGIVEVKSNLPATIDTIYVRATYTGVNQLWKAPIVNNTVDWNQAVAYNNENVSAAKAISSGRTEAYPYSIQYLGTWNTAGLPSYLVSPDEYVDPGLLARINESVPEYRPVPTYNPEYLTSTDKSLFLKEFADVWVTFVHEGAGYLNTLGYYVYDKNNPPKTTSDIKTVTVIYPNLSFSGSGGQLKSGNKVHIGRFDSGQAIGWVLFANAFSNGAVGSGSWALYSNLALNSFISDASKRQHNVLLQDVGFDRIILCFEDIRRDQSSCDNDFNDAIFFITTNPVKAAVTDLMPPLDIPIDSDGDGVTDKYDEYPADQNKAYNQYFPAMNAFNTLSYEDLWPSLGDYDFNDLVMGYNVQQVLNSANQVTELKLNYEVRAVGGSNAIGFGVHLPVSKSLAKQVTVFPSTNHSQALEATGVEANQSQIVVPLFDDAHKIIRSSSGSFTNTQLNTVYITPKLYTVTITFNTPVSTTSLGTAPFDSFIYVNGRSNEVHLPNKSPTDKADRNLFGTKADRSQPALGKYYMNSEGKPWALLIPGNFDYPVEKENMEKAYTYFSDWAKSMGTTRKDWYGISAGYRNTSKIYKKNP